MVLDTGTVLIALFPVEVAAGSVYFWILPVIAIVGLLIGGGKTVYSLTSQRAQEKAERRKYATLQVGHQPKNVACNQGRLRCHPRLQGHS
jgi:hypothetical protein